MKKIAINSGNKIISKDANLLKNPFEKTIGMMFWKKGDFLLKNKSESKFMSAIHTCFCNPLLVVWLDKNLKVVDIKKTKPFKKYSPNKSAMYIFETTNFKKKDKIQKGDTWKIK